MVYGLTVTCCADPREIMATCRQVRPTWFFAVPRIWEKLKAGLEAMLAAQPDEQRERARGRWPRAREGRASSRRARRCPPSSPARSRGRRRAVRRPARELGLDQVESRSTSAPRRRRSRCSSSSTRSGIPLAELWGHVRDLRRGRRATRPTGSRSARSARPAPGVELKLADDGELLSRADVVMPGYRNPPDKTAEAIDARRLAAHRRHRRDRRRRLPEDRRPQEGDDHQRGRQEHVAGQHRGEAQDARAR